MNSSFGVDFGRARFERIIKGTPLCQLGNESETIPHNTMTEFLKNMPYPISEKITVDFRSDGDIVFMTQGKDPFTISLSNHAMTRLPFAVLSLRDIATKLELFLEKKQEGDFPGAGFRLFVLNEGLFDTSRETPTNEDWRKKNTGMSSSEKIDSCPQIFMENGSDNGKMPSCGDLFNGIDVAPNLRKEFLLSEVTPYPGKNKLSISLGGEYGGTYTMEIPLSYTRSMTRDDMVERFSVIYEKTGSDIVYFEEFLVNLEKLETVLGIFPNECLRPLVSILPNSPFLLYAEGSNKKRLFLQGSESLSRIEVVEAPLPGREKEARQKFLGEAIMKKRWAGILWRPDNRDMER